MPTSRLEAFSDGVLAVIITIVVLALPRPAGSAWHSLSVVWPTFLVYVLTFVYIGIYWINHHHMFQVAQQVDARVLWANLHLLFWLSLFPFVTEWAGATHVAAVPMTCYAFVNFMAGTAFTLLARTLRSQSLDNGSVARVLASGWRSRISPAAYAVAVVLPWLGLPGRIASGALLVAIAAVWIVPDRRLERAVGGS